MKIYEEYLNKITEIDVPINIYENQDTLRIFEKWVQVKAEHNFIKKELQENFKNAVMEYCRPGKTYIVHRFKEYYGINMYLNEYEPREIDSEIKVFDEKQIYPLLEIEMKIGWKY